MSTLIQSLFNEGFLSLTEDDKNPIYHIATPCKFIIKHSVVKSLKENYKRAEEIGGILWAKPTIFEDGKVYLVEQVSYIRNAIEDKPYKDKDGRIRTKEDTYLPDPKTYYEAMDNILSANHLPVKFHTHPTKGRNFIEDVTNKHLQTETSDQDRLESSNAYKIGENYLLMPRALIVGNMDFGNDIFIGLYNGFVAPVEFEKIKKEISQENINRIGESISNLSLSNSNKVLLGIGAVLILATLIKYPKYSVPVIVGLALIAPGLLTNTATIETPNYFNKLSFGDAVIYLPAQ